MASLEEKAANFARLLPKRLATVLDGIRILGQLSARNNYAYHLIEVDGAFTQIENATAEARAKFMGELRKAGLLPETGNAGEVLSELAEAIGMPTAPAAPVEHDLPPGDWPEDPDYPVRDWKHMVQIDVTRMGYPAWCAQQHEAARMAPENRKR